MLFTRTRTFIPRGLAYNRSLVSLRPFSRLSIPDPKSQTEATKKMIQNHHNDNWVRALSLNPNTLRRFVTHYEDVFTDETTTLDSVDRETIAVTVSRTNGCGLCQAHHTRGLASALGGDDAAKVRAKKIASDWHVLENLSEKQKALAAFAELVASKPREVGKKDLEKLKQVGFQQEQIVEIVEVAGWFSHSNRLMIALGIEPDDKYFQ
ncbi:peroxidase-related enzyme [Fusarium albosuccineum]|uniref:Peroxidase-related enzyme n=1 Tax=Fusarium albosuccineum TaxID=1237068 RepID=A0A8H4LLX8_9HYPO|nr:peroxidase-related enzyme [Fusarium albosuccineum]